MPPNASSDQRLHCLLTEISMDNAVKMKISTPKTRNGLIQMITMEQSPGMLTFCIECNYGDTLNSSSNNVCNIFFNFYQEIITFVD